MFKFRERLVERLTFSGCGRTAVEQVGLVEFGEPGEELRAVADGQPWEFVKDLSFAHGKNLARLGFSSKHGLERRDFVRSGGFQFCQPFQRHGGRVHKRLLQARSWRAA